MFAVILDYFEPDGSENSDHFDCQSMSEAEAKLAECLALDCCKRAWIIAG